jgi:hypothetical protein
VYCGVADSSRGRAFFATAGIADNGKPHRRFGSTRKTGWSTTLSCNRRNTKSTPWTPCWV